MTNHVRDFQVLDRDQIGALYQRCRLLMQPGVARVRDLAVQSRYLGAHLPAAVAAALSRCKRGSNGRRKVRAQVARLHRKIADTRNTWLHQQSAALIKRADLIAVEDLKVSNMVRHPALARSISDASWSKFVSMLEYKAEKAGAHLIRVDPRNTSQKCSG